MQSVGGHRVWGTGCDLCRLQGVQDERGAAYKGTG